MKAATIRLPEELIDDLSREAADAGLDRNEYIRRILEQRPQPDTIPSLLVGPAANSGGGDSDDTDSERGYYDVVEEYAPDGADVPDRALAPIAGNTGDGSDTTLGLGRDVFRELSVDDVRDRFFDTKQRG